MTTGPGAAARRGLTVVVPLHQEAAGVPDLVAALAAFVAGPAAGRDVELLLVDDGSTDGTAAALESALAAAAGELPARVLRHAENRGLTAALWTGVDAARQPLVGWLDADLTYAPAILEELAAAVDAGADLALASPYHPAGGVVGVPGWRLVLSRTISRLYRRVTRASLHTFTCMVRVWDRGLVSRSRPARGGFLGVTESLLRALELDARVVEVPAILHRRRTGQSKMRVFRVGWQHLGALLETAMGRNRGPTT